MENARQPPHDHSEPDFHCATAQSQGLKKPSILRIEFIPASTLTLDSTSTNTSSTAAVRLPTPVAFRCHATLVVHDWWSRRRLIDVGHKQQPPPPGSPNKQGMVDLGLSRLLCVLAVPPRLQSLNLDSDSQSLRAIKTTRYPPRARSLISSLSSILFFSLWVAHLLSRWEGMDGPDCSTACSPTRLCSNDQSWITMVNRSNLPPWIVVDTFSHFMMDQVFKRTPMSSEVGAMLLDSSAVCFAFRWQT